MPLVDLGPAPTQKKTKGLVDLGPAPTPITEALKAVEPTTEDLEKYRQMGVKDYRSPAGKLYPLTESTAQPFDFNLPTIADPSVPPAGFVPTVAKAKPPQPEPTQMQIGVAPEPTGWQKVKRFFTTDRPPLPPHAGRMAYFDRAFDIAVGSPLRVFLKYSKGRTLNIPDLVWAGIKKITPDSMWDEEVKKMNLDQAMDWAAGYDPSGFQKVTGGLAEFIGRLRTARGIGQATGILGKAPKDLTVLIRAGETAKLFGLAAMSEQFSKLLSQTIDPKTDYQYKGATGVLTDMGIGAGLSLGTSIVKPALAKVAQSAIGKKIIEASNRAIIELSKRFPDLMDAVRKDPEAYFTKATLRYLKARGISLKDLGPKQKAVLKHVARESQRRFVQAYRNYTPPDIVERGPRRRGLQITGAAPTVGIAEPVRPPTAIKPAEVALITPKAPPAPTVEGKEKIVSAAMKVGEKVFTGDSHTEIIREIIKSGELPERFFTEGLLKRKDVDLFLTNKGRLVNLEEAKGLKYEPLAPPPKAKPEAVAKPKLVDLGPAKEITVRKEAKEVFDEDYWSGIGYTKPTAKSMGVLDEAIESAQGRPQGGGLYPWSVRLTPEALKKLGIGFRYDAVKKGSRVLGVEPENFAKLRKQGYRIKKVQATQVIITTPTELHQYAKKWEALAKPKGKPGFVDVTPIAGLGKALVGDIEIEPVLEIESGSFNKHIDYFQGRQLPKTSQVRKIQKQMQVVNGQRLAGTITAREANKKIQQLRKVLLETAEKEGIALRMTPGGKVSVAVRKAGTYVPIEFAEYTKFKDISPVFGGGQDITRAIQQMDGSLTVKQKVKEKGQAGQLEQNVLWPTRDMSLQKLAWLKEKAAELKSLLKARKKSKTDKQVNLILEKIASQDRNVPIKKILSNKTLRSMASPDIIRQAIKLREFYDSLIDEQNIMRKIRGQKEIPYRHNYSPHILRDATIWERMIMRGKKAEDIFASKADLPDYIRPNKPFNPREMAREGGIPYEKRIISARDLAEIYLVTAGKDIFNTSIIQNNKAFIQQLEAMGYKKSANYLADWTAEAYAGVKPRLDRVVGLPVKAQKAALWFNRLRNMAVFPLNFAWNLVVQPSSLALTIGRYGTKNTLQGFLQWLVPSVRRQTAKNYYSYVVKASKQGKITKQDARNLIGSDVKLKMTPGEMIENAGGFITNQIEKLLTGTSIRAAHIHGKKRGLTGAALHNYASDGGAKTQSMYNDEDKPALLRNLTVKTAAPYQTFAYEVVNTAREWVGRTGTPPDTKLYRLWTVLRFLAAASVFAMIAKKLANRDVWSWKRPPIPFAEFWLSPIIRIFSKEYIGGSASGLTSPVGTAQRVAKGIDDVLETGSWRKLRNELLKYGPGIFGIPGGVQISRTVDAIIAYSQGGVRDRRGRLLFKMEDPQDLAQAIFSGVWTTKGGRGYLEKRTGKKEVGKRKKRMEREKRMLRK